MKFQYKTQTTLPPSRLMFQEDFLFLGGLFSSFVSSLDSFDFRLEFSALFSFVSASFSSMLQSVSSLVPGGVFTSSLLSVSRNFSFSVFSDSPVVFLIVSVFVSLQCFPPQFDSSVSWNFSTSFSGCTGVVDDVSTSVDGIFHYNSRGISCPSVETENTGNEE